MHTLYIMHTKGKWKRNKNLPENWPKLKYPEKIQRQRNQNCYLKNIKLNRAIIIIMEKMDIFMLQNKYNV